MSFFPRDYGGSGDGPDPEPWDATVGNLLVPKAHDVYSIYTECLSFKVPPPPEYPRAELPRSGIKIVADGAPRGLRKLYTRELSRAEKIQQAANQLQNEFAEQKRKAEEARDLMDIHIAKQKLAYDKQLAPITNVHKEYSARTRNGIAGHFQLALGCLALPMPANFPWSTFYDANERLLQINQRVPFVTDIVVKRAFKPRSRSGLSSSRTGICSERKPRPSNLEYQCEDSGRSTACLSLAGARRALRPAGQIPNRSPCTSKAQRRCQ